MQHKQFKPIMDLGYILSSVACSEAHAVLTLLFLLPALAGLKLACVGLPVDSFCCEL